MQMARTKRVSSLQPQLRVLKNPVQGQIKILQQNELGRPCIIVYDVSKGRQFGQVMESDDYPFRYIALPLRDFLGVSDSASL